MPTSSQAHLPCITTWISCAAVPARRQVKCTDPCSDMPKLRMLFTVTGTFWVGARKLKQHTFVFAVTKCVFIYCYPFTYFTYAWHSLCFFMYISYEHHHTILYTSLFVCYYVQTCILIILQSLRPTRQVGVFLCTIQSENRAELNTTKQKGCSPRIGWKKSSWVWVVSWR